MESQPVEFMHLMCDANTREGARSFQGRNDETGQIDIQQSMALWLSMAGLGSASPCFISNHGDQVALATKVNENGTLGYFPFSFDYFAGSKAYKN
jgi:hypothetical protein